MEDRVIGPVSLRQIFLLLGGGGTSYIIWALMNSMGIIKIWAGIVAAIPAVIMVLFAFVKVQEISLLRLLFLQIEKSKKPSIRFWQPRKGINIQNIAMHSRASKNNRANQKTVEKTHKSSVIDELSSVLDTEVLSPTESPA
ncbi:PrgI family protein [Candidatus Peregrinibacteria bacterium]|nr:PrgI family protein [Candidatus Peregrinibacteria bacterium]MBT3598609.1 PrgI family protein [Candidatus Peregrinibacteria bacterium]MBT4367024.1 PrgI family protein [Candidatus Peregrinibacteria bacterium]MBT4586129.1 PrgI family protein [Candidatus Peregrinibacteria bacterium]MBT6730604.1 PrgI family protein [Candidatus Peregrinibacteria bacterium]